jgi:hypothetical protein
MVMNIGVSQLKSGSIKNITLKPPEMGGFSVIENALID